MCGISGIAVFSRALKAEEIEAQAAGSKLLRHRGPDYLGRWRDQHVALSHNKLSIFNYDQASNQPFTMGECVLVCNGEIYNYRELCQQLVLRPEDLGSDCEVILHSYLASGTASFTKLRGDFAFALYDRRSRKLYLVRDQMGVKQLVYARYKEGVMFASEAKSFRFYPGFSLLPSLDKIADDWLMGFWGDKEETYFKEVHHIPQGCYLTISDDSTELTKYFRLETLDENERMPERVVERLDEYIETATRERLMGAANLGTLVSGGVDSSLLTALTARIRAPGRMKCFTTRYGDNEANPDYISACLVTREHSNLDHEAVDVGRGKFTDEANALVAYHMEEVLWDRVYLPIFLNYESAKAHGLRVILSGQGADELWAGYYFTFPHYRLCGGNWTTDYLIDTFSQQSLRFADYLRPSFLSREKARAIMEENVARNVRPYVGNGGNDLLNATAFWATRTHLQSNLMQEDRLSMGSSVECRVPHVDIRIAQLAFSCSGRTKIFDGREKYPVRMVARRHLPEPVATRNKFHFPEPSCSFNQRAEESFLKRKKEFASSEVLRQIFNERFFSLLESDAILQHPELFWRATAIERFFETFGENFDRIAASSLERAESAGPRVAGEAEEVNGPL